MTVRRRQPGVTLIELMIVIAIIGVVLTLVAPSFRDVIEMQRLRGVSDQVATDIQFARSEAARLRVPVHIALQPTADGNAGCYMLFTDTNTLPPFSTACDCRQAPGAQCSAAATAPVKVVRLPGDNGLRFAGAAGGDLRMAFDPATGGRFYGYRDRGFVNANLFSIDTFYDDRRKVRTGVGFSGRPSTCAPAGSTVRVPACE